jgi:citronellyl-CoA dehydrogenase
VIETDEHQIFRKTLRDLFEREIEPHIDGWEAARSSPLHELFPKFGAVGLLGLEYD